MRFDRSTIAIVRAPASDGIERFQRQPGWIDPVMTAAAGRIFAMLRKLLADREAVLTLFTFRECFDAGLCKRRPQHTGRAAAQHWRQTLASTSLAC